MDSNWPEIVPELLTSNGPVVDRIAMALVLPETIPPDRFVIFPPRIEIGKTKPVVAIGPELMISKSETAVATIRLSTPSIRPELVSFEPVADAST